MFIQTGIGSFFRPFTVSNEKDEPNVIINKNVTPQKTCNTNIFSTSTTTTNLSSQSTTPPSSENFCQRYQDFNFPEIYFESISVYFSGIGLKSIHGVTNILTKTILLARSASDKAKNLTSLLNDVTNVTSHHSKFTGCHKRKILFIKCR